MLNPNQDENSQDYRKEQEMSSEKARLAESIADEELDDLVRYARNTNIGSILIFILAMLILAIFFGLSLSGASA